MNALEIITELKKNKVVPRVVEGQLRLFGDTGSLSDDLLGQIREKKNELNALVKDFTNQLTPLSIPPVGWQSDYPVSNAQKRIWVLSQLEGGNEAYTIRTGIYMKGPLVLEHLAKAFQASVQRHESLRTVFKEIGGELRQVISDDLLVSIGFEDIRTIKDIKGYLRCETGRSAAWKFDLQQGPLIGVKLFRIAEEEHALILAVHHIVSDGWSITVLLQEVIQAYDHYYSKGHYLPLPLKIQYKDYTDWLAHKIGGIREGAGNFWRDQFSKTVDPLELPADFPRDEIKSFEGGLSKFYLEPAVYTLIHAFCRNHQVTLFNFLRAAVAILLHKLSGQPVITIGTPVSGRTHFELENQIGLYVNTLPLRTEIDPELSFLRLLAGISENSRKAFEYQDYPLDEIVEDLHGRRDTGRNPLFDVMMSLQDIAIGDGRIDLSSRYGLTINELGSFLEDPRQEEQTKGYAKLDLSLNFGSDPGNKFYLEIEYDSRLFAKDRIIRLFGFLRTVILQVLADPGKKTGTIEIAGEAEKNKILVTFNDTAASFSYNKTLPQLFEEQAIRTPEAIALVAGDKEFTYRALKEESGRLGKYLREHYKIGANDLVGIRLARSEWMIISILAVLKSGGAYVPIDPDYPPDRMEYIVSDSRCKALIDEGELQKYRKVKNEFGSGDLELLNKPQDLAYVIYTSGSTGRPKGCMLEHRGIINRIEWMWRELGFGPEDIILQKTAFTFDVSVWEIFIPLCLGAKMVLCPKEDAGVPEHLLSIIQQQKITCLHFVPGMLAVFIDSLFGRENIRQSLSGLNKVITSGEALSPATVRDWYARTDIPVHNLYGPTEASVDVTAYTTSGKESRMPIGRPIWNTSIYIVNHQFNVMPVGVTGEICLAGIGLARGYLNNPALTAEKFPADPFTATGRLYRTGDLGRWLADGNIEFIGRKDDQVKIRGYRVEPGEIQGILERHPLMVQAVVMAKTIDGEIHLVAYWVGKDELTTSLLKDHLALYLPDYMIPAFWVKMDSIPLNNSGKTDKKKLPDPAWDFLPSIGLMPPQNPMQRRLLDLWKEVLPGQELGIRQNFFDRGGHSLKAARLRSLIALHLGKELTLNDLFRFPTIEKQALLVTASSGHAPAGAPIPKANQRPFYPISYAQERLWVLTGFEEASKAYNMPAAFLITGKLEIDVLEEAFKIIIRRHEALRTVFMDKDGHPVQVIAAPEDITFNIRKIELDYALTEEEERRFLQKSWLTPFDLKTGPLLSCFLLTTGERQLLSFNIHHIISDGRSVDIIYKEVIGAYRKMAAGMNWEPGLPDLQYRDFAVWQRTQLTPDKLGSLRKFWKQQFNGEVPVLELPNDFPRPEIRTYKGAALHYRFDPLIALKINQMAARSGATLFMALLAAVNVLLKKYSDQNDIVVGTPMEGRDHPGLRDQIGFYVNTMPVRTRLDGQAGFQSILQSVKETILKTFEFQDFPFEMLLNELSVKRNLSRSPLFDVVVALGIPENQETEDTGQVLPGLRFDRMYLPTGVAKYELVFLFTEGKKGLSLELEYNTGLFREETIARMAGHLSNLLEQVTENPEIALKEIDLLDAKERAILLCEADRTGVAYDKKATLVSLFRQAADRFPDNIALITGGKKITYRELDTKTGQLARILIEERKVMPEDLVLLHFERSEWMIIGMLAVLKAGAAYVPVDPDYPSSRIDYIMEDCQSQLVLFDKAPGTGMMEKWKDIHFLDITIEDYTGDMALADINPDNLAYVIYTSGTTGNPKGVLIEHRNVTRLFFTDNNLFTFDSNDRWSLFHSYCFDFSVWEMYGALLYGASLVIVPKEIAQDALAFFDFLGKERITVLNQTPTAFRSLAGHTGSRLSQPPAALRYLIFGGEALFPEILRSWFYALPGCRMVNMYGITETTVHVTYKLISEQDITGNTSNIGSPLPTLSCFVLDKDQKQVPVGVIGELCVGGAGVARGYLNKPELTAEKFMADPLRPGEKIYRSGDYARILSSGELEYIGRKDDQVKIRGHRIEIKEIESAILRTREIQDVVVLPLSDSTGETELAAYFIPKAAGQGTALRVKLNDILPAYMVPSYLIPLSSFPRNANGKLDKEALPAPQDFSGGQTDHTPGRNETDRQIAAIWEGVLVREKIGIKDNFFDLGGNSLKAARIMARIHERLGVKVDLKNLFTNPTIEHLSDYIETVQWMKDKSEVPVSGESEAIF